ncbi:MAG: flagellar biosynthetic protein FliO [Oleiphilaceae bacterium]|nr:flagellar biosynthetic protein FliO [Oleiphilaceae bacterium]
MALKRGRANSGLFVKVASGIAILLFSIGVCAQDNNSADNSANQAPATPITETNLPKSPAGAGVDGKSTASGQGPESVQTERPISNEVRTDATEPRAQVKVTEVSSWYTVALSLIGIVVLIFAFGWAARRMGGLRAMGIRDMKVIAALPVGTREKVALVQVQGKQFLLGITAHQITHLHTFDEVASESPNPSKDFMSTLQGVIGKNQEATHDS